MDFGRCYVIVGVDRSQFAGVCGWWIANGSRFLESLPAGICRSAHVQIISMR